MILSSLSSCKRKPVIARAPTNPPVQRAEPPTYCPKGFFLPRQKVIFGAFELVDFELMSSYIGQHKVGDSTINVPVPASAHGDFNRLSYPQLHGIDLYTDTVIVVEDSLYLQFGPSQMGGIQIGGMLVAPDSLSPNKYQKFLRARVTVMQDGQKIYDKIIAFDNNTGLERVYD
jgi:hypothetical protein